MQTIILILYDEWRPTHEAYSFNGGFRIWPMNKANNYFKGISLVAAHRGTIPFSIADFKFGPSCIEKWYVSCTPPHQPDSTSTVLTYRTAHAWDRHRAEEKWCFYFCFLKHSLLFISILKSYANHSWFAPLLSLIFFFVLPSLISQSSAPTVGFQFPHYPWSLVVHTGLISAVSLCDWTGVVQTHIFDPPMGVTAFKLAYVQPPFFSLAVLSVVRLFGHLGYGAAPSWAGRPLVP